MEKMKISVASLFVGLGLGILFGFQSGQAHEKLRNEKEAETVIGVKATEIDSVVAEIYKLMYVAECNHIRVNFNPDSMIEHWSVEAGGSAMLKHLRSTSKSPIIESLNYKNGSYYLTSKRGDLFVFKNGDLTSAVCDK